MHELKSAIIHALMDDCTGKIDTDKLVAVSNICDKWVGTATTERECPYGFVFGVDYDKHDDCNCGGCRDETYRACRTASTDGLHKDITHVAARLLTDAPLSTFVEDWDFPVGTPQKFIDRVMADVRRQDNVLKRLAVILRAATTPHKERVTHENY